MTVQYIGLTAKLTHHTVGHMTVCSWTTDKMWIHIINQPVISTAYLYCKTQL